MLNARDKMTIAFAILSTILLIIALVCSVVFAAFTANKTATTTLKFHSGIEISITKGIDNTTNRNWQYAVDGSTTYSTTGTPLTQLQMSDVAVSVTKGAPCFIRVFYFISINNSAEVLPDTSNFNGLADATLSTNETTFKTNNTYPNGTSVAYAGTRQLTNGTAVTVINPIDIFKLTADSEGNYAQDENFNGRNIRAYFRIYASTDEFTKDNQDTWNTSYFDFSFSI